MDEDELVHELVNSLAFEVEAIPTDNIIKFTSTNGTPLNVKVRVRNKDEPRLVQRGIVSVPKLAKHISSVDKIRLISSDQTILSFNVYMETELDKPSPPKNRKHGFKFFKLGGCLGTSYDEVEGPYLPGPSSKKALKSRTSSKSDSDFHPENKDGAEKLKLSLEASNAVTRDQKKLFGKCKPGGCLDPPFGEDKEKEPYLPTSVQAAVSKVEDSKVDQKISVPSVKPGKSSKAPSKSHIKELKKDVIEPTPLLDIYARPVSLEHSSTSHNSNATKRQPSKMSSSKMLDTGKKNSKSYNDDSLRQSYQYPETYFIPPKDLLQNKEEERRYSRERSNDRIRPVTTRQENDHQTSNIPHIIDVPNKIYPENVDANSYQSTKLLKHKGKDNTEIIKQTLTDLTCNEIDNAPKASEDFQKNSKTPLNVPLVSQKVKTTSSYIEIPSADATYNKNLDDFNIPITSDNLDISFISKTDPDEAKNPSETNSKENYQKDREAIEISSKGKPITEKLYEPENKYLSKDMRNKNVLKSDEPTKPETINIAKPESGKLEDLNISPILVSGQGAPKIVQLLPSSDSQNSSQTNHLPYDLNGTLTDKPTKTSDKITKATNSTLSLNIEKDQTKLLMTVRLPSLEHVLDVDDTNDKNDTMLEAQLKDNDANEKKDTNVYPDTAKYVDDMDNLAGRKTSQEHIDASQELKDSKPKNKNPSLLVSGVDEHKIKKSLITGEIPKKQIHKPKPLVSEVDDGKIDKCLRTGEMPKKQINGNKNIQEERIRDSQISNKSGSDNYQNIQKEQIPDSQIGNKLEVDMVQKPFNDFPVFKDTERETLQDLELSTVDSYKSYNLVGVENHDKTIEDKLSGLKSRNTPSNDVNVKEELQSNTNLITNQKQFQNTTPSETFQKQVLDEQYRRIEVNQNTNVVPNSAVEAGIAETFIHEPIKSNKHIANISDISLNNDEDFNTVIIRKPKDITKETSEIFVNSDKQVQDSIYTKNKLSDNKVSSFGNAFNSDDEKIPVTASIVDSGHIKRQLVDTSIINNQKSPTRNLSHDSILNTDTESALSSTNSVETNNLNYDDNEKPPLNKKRTENDNVIIKNTSLHDRNKNFTINTQDKIPSDILHKPPLIRTEDSDLRNDDINVIKAFKRNTFTIVASRTSLEKQEEPILIPQANYTTDEQLNAKKNKKMASNDQTTIDSERTPQNDQQNKSGFLVDKQETIKTNPFLNINANSDTSLKINDISRESYNETENHSKDLGPHENQTTNNIKIISNTISDDKIGTNNYEKPYLASDYTSNDINTVDYEIRKSQDQTDNKMYNKEKLILTNLPDDLVKRISELQDRSNNDFGHLRIEPKIHNNETFENGVFNKNLNDTTAENTSIQKAYSKSRESTDDLPNNKISVVNISIKEAEGSSVAERTKDTEKKAPEETVAVMSNEKLSTSYARNEMEYGPRLLEMSEDKFYDKLDKPKNTPDNISQLIVVGEPDEYISKLLSVENSGKVLDTNAELNTQTKYTRDQTATIVDEDDNVRKKMDLGAVESVDTIIDKKSLLPEDDNRYYVNKSVNGNLRKTSDSGTIGSITKIIDQNLLESKRNTIYSDNDNDTKIDEEGNFKIISESYSDKNFNKDKTPIVSKDGTKYYHDYDSPTKLGVNGDLRKMSGHHSEGNFNEDIDEKPLLAKYDIAHNIDYSITRAHADGGSGQQFDGDTMQSFDKAIDEKPLVPKDGIGYSSESAISSKATILVDNLINFDQFGPQLHLNIKQHAEQSDPIGLKQRLGLEESVQNENESILNKTGLEVTISSPMHKTRSKVLILNLALQSYVNDTNNTVVQTISPLVEPVRHTDDNITVVQSLIRHGQEITIPVDVDNDLSLKFTTKTHQIPQNFNTDPNSFKKGRITRNLSEHAHHHPENINKSLAFIYEKELIPLHNVIKNLTEEINTLTTQQELLKDKMRGAKRTKSLRLIPVNKHCGCGRM